MKYLKELMTAIQNEDFFETNEILKKVKLQKDAFDYLIPIFNLIEETNLDLGTPGPVVHFMESYYKKGYEQLLLESIQRFPTSQTIWMLNRIINDPYLIDKEKYIDVLVSLLNRKDIPENVLVEVQEFCKYQQSK